MRHSLRLLGFLTLFGLLFTGPALAQTGPTLLAVDQIPAPFRAQAEVRTTSASPDTNTQSGNLDVLIIESFGLARLERTTPGGLVLGYEVTYLDLEAGDPVLPQRAIDQRLSIGRSLGSYDFGGWVGQWSFSGTAGLGYSTTHPYSDGNAFYGNGTLLGMHQIDPSSSLWIFVEYNGNRSVFPDVPLPGFTYNKRFNETWSAQLGFPFGSVSYTPNERLKATLTVAPPFGISGNAQYKLSEHLSTFVRLRRETSAFFEEGQGSSTRLFYSRFEADLGLEAQLTRQFILVPSVGVLFDQEFERGFDRSNADNVADLDAAFFVRLTAKLRF